MNIAKLYVLSTRITLPRAEPGSDNQRSKLTKVKNEMEWFYHCKVIIY